MNRIRKVGNIYQVLITPEIKMSPDSALMLGNWDDESLRNYSVMEFDSLNDAQYEAYKYPDINWYRLSLNHREIFLRLKSLIKEIIDQNHLNVEFVAELMDADQLKYTMFQRVIKGGERFNLRFGMNDIIRFDLINPWTVNLQKISKLFETHLIHLYRDDLRLRSKKIIDDTVICLYGSTELGTTYEIRFVPTLIQQWGQWYKKAGYTNSETAMKLYNDILKQQKTLDAGPILR